MRKITHSSYKDKAATRFELSDPIFQIKKTMPTELLQGNSPDPGIKPKSPELAGGFFTAEPPGKVKEKTKFRQLFPYNKLPPGSLTLHKNTSFYNVTQNAALFANKKFFTLSLIPQGTSDFAISHLFFTITS